MSYGCENIHENVVNENDWGDLECLQKPTETDKETGRGLLSDIAFDLFIKYI